MRSLLGFYVEKNNRYGIMATLKQGCVMKRFWYWLIGVKPANKKVLEKVVVKKKFKKAPAKKGKKNA